MFALEQKCSISQEWVGDCFSLRQHRRRTGLRDFLWALSSDGGPSQGSRVWRWIDCAATLPAVPSVLDDFYAFLQEHRHCGELESGVTDDRVWMECDCGARITEPPRRSETESGGRPLQQ